MKVLALLRYFPTLSESFVYNELKSLEDLGINLLIARIGPRADGDLVPPHLLPRAPLLEAPRRPWSSPWRRLSPGERWLEGHQREKDVRRYRWLRERLPPLDRAHVHFAGEAAEWAYALQLDTGLPYSLVLHAVDIYCPRPSFAEVVAAASPALTIATANQTWLDRMGLQSQLLRCGPRLGTPQPWPAGPMRAIFAARDRPKKGLDTLLHAWAHPPPQAMLEVIGPQPRPSSPEAQHPQVQFKGPLSPEQVSHRISSSHLGVLPARLAPDGDRDGIPLFLMECLAAGRPVLSTPIGGIPELVDEEVGWLIAPDSPTELREALWSIDLLMAAERGKRGPERLLSRGFTLDQQVQGLLHAWQAAKPNLPPLTPPRPRPTGLKPD